jgi:aspartate/methionine/tyrosine aminotransferase
MYNSSMNNNLRKEWDFFLAPRAREWSLPRSGFMKQGAEAAHTELNASIGVALKDNGTPLTLPSLTALNTLPPTAMLYSGCTGQGELRKKWAVLKGQDTLPVVTAGLTHAMNLAGHLFLSPGDTLHIPSPVYENYHHMYSGFFGAQIRDFPLTMKTEGGEDILNTRAMEKILESHDEIIRFLFNFPQNPTGYSPTCEDVDRLLPLFQRVAEGGKKIIIILDDAYHGLNHEKDIFEDSLFTPLSKLHGNILTIKVDGATKEYYAWGLRVGFLSFGRKGMTNKEYEFWEDKAASVVRATISNVSRLAQEMLLEALNSPDINWEQQKNIALIGSRFKQIKEELNLHPEYAERFKALPFNSGYFFCVRLSHNINAEKVRNRLREEFSTGVMVPCEGMIRMAYSSLPGDRVASLLNNLYRACG